MYIKPPKMRKIKFWRKSFGEKNFEQIFKNSVKNLFKISKFM